MSVVLRRLGSAPGALLVARAVLRPNGYQMCQTRLNATMPPGQGGGLPAPVLALGAAAFGTAAYLGFSDGFYPKPPPTPAALAKAVANTAASAPAAAEATTSNKEAINEAADLVQPAPELAPLGAVYVIVGAGTAAFFATRGIQERDPVAKILIIGEEQEAPYMRPPLSKELWFREDASADAGFDFKDWNGKQRNIYHQDKAKYCSAEELMQQSGSAVALLCGHRVTSLDVNNKELTLDNGRTVLFERCLIATGGRPKNIAIFEQAKQQVKDRVVLFRKAEDFHRLHKLVQSSKTIAIVGGGFLGSELAVGLAHNTKGSDTKIVQMFPEKGNMAKVLPEYLCKWTTNKVKSAGVDVKPESRVVAAEMAADGSGVILSLDNGGTVQADHVVVAVGLEPNTELAKSARLETDGSKGGILVNAELEARTDVWAAGDVASFYDVTLGRRREEHYDHAVVSGRLAGENMAGASKPYTHQSMFWSDLGPEVEYQAIGVVDSALPTVGVWAKADSSPPPTPTPATEGAAANAEDPGYGKGVVFYMRDDRVVGMVLWNVYGKIPVARKVIRDAKQYHDKRELTKLFQL